MVAQWTNQYSIMMTHRRPGYMMRVSTSTTRQARRRTQSHYNLHRVSTESDNILRVQQAFYLLHILTTNEYSTRALAPSIQSCNPPNHLSSKSLELCLSEHHFLFEMAHNHKEFYEKHNFVTIIRATLRV